MNNQVDENSGIRIGIIEYIDQYKGRCTNHDLLCHVSCTQGVEKRKIRRELRALVEKGVLEFNFPMGHAFVSRSFNRPLRVGRRIILVPENQTYLKEKNEKIVRLKRGGSFGDGSHATTRLMLEGMDVSVTEGKEGFYRGLDIGTGSGVLAIAAAHLGCRKIMALDIDSIARSEAMDNIELNELTDRIEVSGRAWEYVIGKFDLIMTNLRPPTLINIIPLAEKWKISGSMWILSGYRKDETRVEGCLTEAGWKCIWRKNEDDWAASVFQVT